jgi:all-trans-retinol 13,14-reductase
MIPYDCIIIGSGLGGLECGVILAREGMKVLILEKNRQFGGALQIFSRDKRIIDTGVHYIGGLGEGQNLNRIFNFLGIQKNLRLKKMDEECFDLIRFEDDESEYKQAQGFENYLNTLSGYFPHQRIPLNEYIYRIQKIAESVPLFNLEDRDYSSFDNPDLSESASEYLSNLFSDEKLKGVLAGSSMLYAGRRNATPLYEHALIMHSYISGAYKCIDGGAQIANLLVDEFKNAGGEILNYQEVSLIKYQLQGLWEVETSNSNRFQTKRIISDVHPSMIFPLIHGVNLRKAYVSRLNALENSISAFCIHFVMKPGHFKSLNYNIYSFKNADIWNATNASGSENFYCYGMFDAPMSNDNGFAKIINVMCYMNFDEVLKWKDTFRTFPHFTEKRSDEYEAFKEQKAQKVLELIKKKFPDIEHSVQSIHTTSPLTFRDYLNTPMGSIYGISKNARQPLNSIISAKTPMPEFYLTGQNLNLHGVLGVSLSSIVTCGEILGRNFLLNKINSNS